MQSDFQNIKELKIIKEQITKIENGNQMFKLMGASLRKLDLSLNLLKYFENFELLQNLRELNLSFNLIEDIQYIERLPNLKSLILDSNKIKKIGQIKGLRKLEYFSIQNNYIRDY